MPTLNWIGKEKILNHHQDVPFRVLDHQYGFTENGHQKTLTENGNLIIHGDNLEALKALLPQYKGQVDIIYIDPPYNTGKEKWLYTDNVNHPKIEKWLNEIVGVEGEDLSRHDKWLCMMYPRLKLIHTLLKDDGGVFFCSIDDYEHGNLRPIIDEIFGPQNFMNNVIWQRAYSPVNTKKRFSQNHDFIICYAKNKNSVNLLLPRTEEANDRYFNPDNDPRGVWKSSDLSVAPVIEEKLYKITTPSGREVYPPQGRCWVLTEDRYIEFLQDKRIWFGENEDATPSVKKFLSEVKDGMTPLTVWTYDEVGHTQDAKREIKELFPNSKLPFETPKPTKLMEKIISLTNNKNAIILDSFAGTASTAHAVLKLNRRDGGNRKFIMIEMEDYAETITAERVKKVIIGYDFKGNKKSELSSYSTNLTNLKKANKIIEEYTKYKEDKKYADVNIESSKGNIVITGIEQINGRVEGIMGSFDFFNLGQPLFTKSGYLNDLVTEDNIRNYIYYTETQQILKKERSKENWYLLDNLNNTGYYFYYEKEKLTTLDLESLSIVKEKKDQYLIYADNCLLDKDFMISHNIFFKKIPRDIRRF